MPVIISNASSCVVDYEGCFINRHLSVLLSAMNSVINWDDFMLCMVYVKSS